MRRSLHGPRRGRVTLGTAQKRDRATRHEIDGAFSARRACPNFMCRKEDREGCGERLDSRIKAKRRRAFSDGERHLLHIAVTRSGTGDASERIENCVVHTFVLGLEGERRERGGTAKPPEGG